MYSFDIKKPSGHFKKDKENNTQEIGSKLKNVGHHNKIS